MLTALRPQPGTQVFNYFDQRQHNVLTSIQNVINYAPQFLQQVNLDVRIRIGRILLQNVVNLLHNQQIQTTPQNVNGALQAITQGQLSLQDMGDVAIPSARRWYLLPTVGRPRGDQCKIGGSVKRDHFKPACNSMANE